MRCPVRRWSSLRWHPGASPCASRALRAPPTGGGGGPVSPAELGPLTAAPLLDRAAERLVTEPIAVIAWHARRPARPRPRPGGRHDRRLPEVPGAYWGHGPDHRDNPQRDRRCIACPHGCEWDRCRAQDVSHHRADRDGRHHHRVARGQAPSSRLARRSRCGHPMPAAARLCPAKPQTPGSRLGSLPPPGRRPGWRARPDAALLDLLAVARSERAGLRRSDTSRHRRCESHRSRRRSRPADSARLAEVSDTAVSRRGLSSSVLRSRPALIGRRVDDGAAPRGVPLHGNDRGVGA
jgi:hypothetical protein